MEIKNYTDHTINTQIFTILIGRGVVQQIYLLVISIGINIIHRYPKEIVDGTSLVSG